jgi:hypothetical protein
MTDHDFREASDTWFGDSDDPEGAGALQLDQLANEWLDRKADLEKAQQLVADVEGALLDHMRDLNISEHQIVPGVGVRVDSGAARWNDTQAGKMLTPEQVALISEPKMSSKKADALVVAGILPAEIVALCRVRSKPGLRRL